MSDKISPTDSHHFCLVAATKLTTGGRIGACIAVSYLPDGMDDRAHRNSALLLTEIPHLVLIRP